MLPLPIQLEEGEEAFIANYRLQKRKRKDGVEASGLVGHCKTEASACSASCKPVWQSRVAIKNSILSVVADDDPLLDRDGPVR